MNVSEEIHDAGQEVASATGQDLPDVLNHALRRFLGWPFKITAGYAVDRGGNKSATFATVIHTAPATAIGSSGAIPADAVGAVVDVCENVDSDGFRAAYRRIAQAKTLRKDTAPCVKAVPITTVTLGIIFALHSTLSLEDLAEELNRLNTQTPNQQWPDMIVVVSAGVVNYAVQFPGEQLSGDFLPPAEGALASYTPPIYVIVVMRPTGRYTFNKMLAFLIAHLRIFSPGARLPDWVEVLRDVPQLALTLSGYQYNLRGQLLPVPRQFYNDRYIAPLPVRIEDRNGALLSTLQFLPWQDGGVILARGQLPLGNLLLVLDREMLRRAGVVKRPHAQISYVLPMTQRDFAEMLARIQARYNAVARGDPTKWVVQKFADEGSQSLFMARLLLGMLRLRDVVFPNPSERDKFDRLYEFVVSSLLNARTAVQQIGQMWEDHVRKVTSGAVARLRGTTIQIDESIDQELRRQVESFVNAAVRALKQGMQDLAKSLQVDIGLLFQKQAAFDSRLAVLQATDAPLAEYLRQTRSWSEPLLEVRNTIEHEGWMLSRVTYSQTDSGVTVEQPRITSQPVLDFARFIFDRLTCFVEEVTAHCLQRRMPPEISVTEIAPADRVAEAPERFKVTLANGSAPVWHIVYHRSPFEET
jgi:hypothetical protein